MNVENNPFQNFKSYNHFKSQKVVEQKKAAPRQIGPLIGSAIGVAGALYAAPKLPKAKNNKIVNEVSELLLMAGSANIGGVLGGSIGKTKEQKKKKWKEAAFQIMNISIPMLMVSSALGLCDKVSFLKNNPSKIVGSIIGMTSGAAIATAITNATREEGTPYRKYTIKDSIANFDDIIMTIKIGFEKILNYVPVDKILPFIYIYSGTRAGQKE